MHIVMSIAHEACCCGVSSSCGSLLEKKLFLSLIFALITLKHLISSEMNPTMGVSSTTVKMELMWWVLGVEEGAEVVFYSLPQGVSVQLKICVKKKQLEKHMYFLLKLY